MSRVLSPFRTLWHWSEKAAIFLITLQVFVVALFLIAAVIFWLVDVYIGQTGLWDRLRETLIRLLGGVSMHSPSTR